MIKKLDTFIYYSMLFPFLQPFLKLDTDLTIYFIIGIIFRLIFSYKTLIINKLNFLFIIFSLFLSFYLTLNGLKFTKSFSPFLVSLMLIFFNNSVIEKHVIKNSVYVYLMATIFWIVTPDLALKIQSVFVREINGGGLIGTRGYPILSTEPGLFGGMIIMIAELYRRYFKDYKFKFIILTLLIFSSFLSFSGSSMIYIILFAVSNNIFKIKKKYLVLTSLILVTIIPVLLTLENRFSMVLKVLYNADFSLLLNDSSLSHRFSGFLTGIIVLFKNPLPFSDNIVYETNLYYQEYLSQYFPYTDIIHWVSSLGTLFSFGGLLSLLWIILLLMSLPRIKDSLFLIISISFSYSLLFPIGYLIAYSNKHINKTQKKISHM